MMRFRNILAGLVCLMPVAMGHAQMAEVQWKGLGFSSGHYPAASVSATIDANNHLVYSTQIGAAAQGSGDHWHLQALLPGSLTQANAPWIEFSFVDAPGAGLTEPGARVYVEDYIASDPYMLQGGVRSPGHDRYLLNHAQVQSGSWVIDDMTSGDTGITRTAGEHAVKFGMTTAGDIDMFFDGAKVYTIAAASWNVPAMEAFDHLFLGIYSQTSPANWGHTGQIKTVTFTNLKFGTGYGQLIAPVSGNDGDTVTVGDASVQILGGNITTPVTANVLDIDRRNFASEIRDFATAQALAAGKVVYAFDVEIDGSLPPGVGVALTFNFADVGIDPASVLVPDDVAILHYNESTDQWEDVTGTVDLANQTVSTTKLENFSPLAVTTIPEPATLLLIAAGLTVCLGRRR